jgi:hypothetical protein
MLKAVIACLGTATFLLAQLPGGTWSTDLSKKSIDLGELRSGGPPKDGIRALDNPKFVSNQAASSWLDPKEPVMVVEHSGTARAYPIQILIYHELVNDQIEDLPFLVSYCPLCNNAVVFDRRLNGKVYVFGVSGMLRNNDMVMFDRETESLWQQITGEAIVGTFTGKRLEILSSLMVSFETFQRSFPEGAVLSRETGHRRPYGETPYEGYEFRSRLARASNRNGLSPTERLIVFSVNGETIAYPFSQLRRWGVVSGRVKGSPYVVFFRQGTVSPLDSRRSSEGRDVGSAGVFYAELDCKRLKFKKKGARLVDKKTGSTWSLLGIATDGPLAGKRLKPLPYHEAFTFAWLIFRPDTRVIGLPGSSAPEAGPPSFGTPSSAPRPGRTQVDFP